MAAPFFSKQINGFQQQINEFEKINGFQQQINEFEKVWTNDKQYFALKSLADATSQYASCWTVVFAEETKSKPKHVDAIAEQLLTALKLALQCFHCGTNNYTTATLPSPGEFVEIIDDVKHVAQMMNRLIEGVLKSSIGHAKSDTEKKACSYKQDLLNLLQKKVELDCSVLQATVKWASQLECQQQSKKMVFIDQIDLKGKRWLAEGSFADVYKANWHQMPVAIKEFKNTDSWPDNYEQSVLSMEMDPLLMLQTSDSSHIVKVIGTSKDANGRRNIVLEFMQKDLRKLITERNQNQNPPFSILESIEIMLQIGKGMRHLHENNVVHRDLKPQNVLVSFTDDDDLLLLVKLADFGICKTNFKTSTSNSMNQGTMYYMAPEIRSAGNEIGKYTRKVDVYSFAVLCFEILTGESISDVMKERIPSLPDDMPDSLKILISRCWDEKESERPTFSEICEMLWIIKEECFTSFQHVCDDYLQKVKRQIVATVKKNQIILEGRSSENIMQQYFVPLFKEIMEDAEKEFKPFGKQVPAEVHSCYNKIKDLENAPSLEMAIQLSGRADLEIALDVSNLTTKIHSCLANVKQYNDNIVDEVINLTSCHIQVLEQRQQMNVVYGAVLHKHARKLVSQELKQKQEVWDNAHNVPRRLKEEEDRLRGFFATCVLLSQLKDKRLLRCLEASLKRSFALLAENEAWFTDYKVWRAKLDLHLLKLEKEGKIDLMLEYIADGQKHNNFVWNLELQHRLTPELKRNTWEAYVDDFRRSFDNAIVKSDKSIKIFIEELKGHIGDADIAKFLDGVAIEFYEEYERRIDYRKIAREFASWMRECFGQLCGKKLPAPWCAEGCPQCGSCCFLEAGHLGTHDTVHQPQGLIGTTSLLLISELVAKTCPDVARESKFPQLTAWAIPRAATGTSKFREYVFFQYQENLVKKFPGKRKCSEIPLTYDRDIEVLEDGLMDIIYSERGK